MPELRGNGPDRDCVLDAASGVGQLQEIPEVNAHPVAGGGAFPLHRDPGPTAATGGAQTVTVTAQNANRAAGDCNTLTAQVSVLANPPSPPTPHRSPRRTSAAPRSP